MTALSIDWDYFFDGIPHAGYTYHGLVTSWGDKTRKPPVFNEKRFDDFIDKTLSSFIGSNFDMLVCENHATAFWWFADKHNLIFNFDHHLDDSPPPYGKDFVTCGSWITHFNEANESSHVLTLLPSSGPVLPLSFTRSVTSVFFCRSAPWTPPECDELFLQKAKVIQESIGHVRQYYVEEGLNSPRSAIPSDIPFDTFHSQFIAPKYRRIQLNTTSGVLVL